MIATLQNTLRKALQDKKSALRYLFFCEIQFFTSTSGILKANVLYETRIITNNLVLIFTIKKSTSANSKTDSYLPLTLSGSFLAILHENQAFYLVELESEL